MKPDRIPLILALALITALPAANSCTAQPRDAGGAITNIPDGVKVVGDIAYRDGPSKAWRLDLAMPTEPSDTPRPGIVFVHGGGWRSGDKRKENFLRPTLEFAAKGYVCITVNYRLLNETSIAGCVEDVKCAVRWLRAHADEYGLDPKRIGAYGNSAGAHLVAMLGLCPPSAGLEGDGPWQEHSSMVQAVVASATPTSFLIPMNDRISKQRTENPKNQQRRDAPGAAGRSSARSRLAGMSQELRKKISPITYVNVDAPPFLLIHGDADRTVGVYQSDSLVKALREAGAKDVTYMRYTDGSGHGVFGAKIAETGPAREAFFARTLKKKESPELRGAQQFFRKNDRNGDGKLSREEFPERMRQMFARIDANKDGFLTLAEDASFRRSRQSRQQRPNRSAGTQLPAGATLERDIVYSQVGDRKLLLDLCLPADRSAPVPVIVWVHGGGWRNGSKNAGSRARGMLERGYAVVDVGYRLSGEAIWPAQIEDCKAAIRWIRANAAKYSFDPDRIGAWGGSAGGHLVAFLGTSGDVKEFDTKTNAQYSSRVQAVCDWFGPTDFLQMDKHMIEGSRLVHDAPGSPESLLVGGPIQDEPYKSLAGKADPITYVTKDDPPFLIMHGDKDMLVPLHQSEILLDALKKAGVSASLYIVKGGGHGLRGGKETPEELFEMVADFFDRQLKTPKPKPASASRRGAGNRPQLRAPTYANVSYGPHSQNVIDFYKAESHIPTPVAVYIHGGGFRGGSKRSLNAGTLRELLDAGISVAAIEYRFISHELLPAAHHDSLRALQFIRYKAGEWNIDKARVGAFGGSAGAQICMWLAFHDEMADPTSSDPVRRESSRLTCVATSGGQTTMDFDWWMKWIPGYDKPHRERVESFGDITDDKLKDILKDISALSIISDDDVPIFMSYGMKPDDPVPSGARAQGWKVHHVMFGIKLKEKMDELGLEADLKYPGAETTYQSQADFFIRKLKARNN